MYVYIRTFKSALRSQSFGLQLKALLACALARSWPSNPHFFAVHLALLGNAWQSRRRWGIRADRGRS